MRRVYRTATITWNGELVGLYRVHVGEDEATLVKAAGDADATVTVALDSGGVNNQAGSTVGGPGPIPHPNI